MYSYITFLSRLAHHPKLYKHVHKLHHTWQAPVAAAAAYAHPIEHMTVNAGPLLISAALTCSHVVSLYFWLASVVYITLYDHSGYHMPFAPSPQHHDYHHLK